MPRITPNLWFDTQDQEAAEFYVSVFPDAAIANITHYGEAGPRPAGTILTVEFLLDGQPFTAGHAGHARDEEDRPGRYSGRGGLRGLRVREPRPSLLR